MFMENKLNEHGQYSLQYYDNVGQTQKKTRLVSRGRSGVTTSNSNVAWQVLR